MVRSGVVGSGFRVVDRGRLGMIRSGSGSMVGSGLGGVIGSRLGMVGSWCGLGVIGLIVGLTLVLDVSDVTVLGKMHISHDHHHHQYVQWTKITMQCRYPKQSVISN